MIQSVKFDSSNMNIKNISNIALGFIVKRLTEAFGYYCHFIWYFNIYFFN